MIRAALACSASIDAVPARVRSVAGQDVVEVGVAVGDDQIVVEAEGGVVGAVDQERLVGLGLDQHHAFHRHAGALWHGP